MAMRILGAVVKTSRRSTHLAVVLVLIASSAASSGLLFYVYAFYNYHEMVFASLPANSVVVSSLAMAPFTSFIDAGKAKKVLENISGVKAILEEVIVLVIAEDKTIVIRGVDPGALELLAPGTRFVKGEKIGNCIGCVWLSSGLAKELGKDVGDLVSVCSFFTRTCRPLLVRGIYTGPPPFGYEALTNLWTARDLRGLHSDQASVLLVVLEKGVDASIVLQKFNISVRETSLLARFFIALQHMGRMGAARLYLHASDLYLARLHVQREVLVLGALAIAFFASASSILVGRFFARRIHREAFVLRISGLEDASIRLSIIVLIALYAAIASIAGYFLARILYGFLGVKLFGYPVVLMANSPEIVLIVFAASLVLSMLGALSCRSVNEL